MTLYLVAFRVQFEPEAMSVSLVVFLLYFSAAYAAVAVIQGTWYTTNLATNLRASGFVNVDEPTTYTSLSLSVYSAIIHYGNSFVDFTALEAYVNGGGILITTPWVWRNLSPTPALAAITPGPDLAYSVPIPSVSVLLPGDPLVLFLS